MSVETLTEDIEIRTLSSEDIDAFKELLVVFELVFEMPNFV